MWRLLLTLFPDETVIAVVRIVRVSETSVRVLKLQEFMTVLSRVTGAKIEYRGVVIHDGWCVRGRRKSARKSQNHHGACVGENSTD
jgi:hypothetical protein